MPKYRLESNTAAYQINRNDTWVFEGDPIQPVQAATLRHLSEKSRAGINVFEVLSAINPCSLTFFQTRSQSSRRAADPTV